MSYFLGFIPDKESKQKIRDVAKEVSIMFSDFGIPVRWVKPSGYHITLYHLGERLFFLNQILLKKKISKIEFRKIKITLGNVKVGISRNYKELVYIDLKEGGEELRRLLLEVRKNVSSEDVSMFVPHITIGRISKDLSQEEYRNLIRDISNVSKKLNLRDIQFTVSTLYLIRSKEGTYSFEMKFEAI